LESQFGARELANLAKPGHFFDFTRYRPTLYLEEDIHQMSIPNVTLRYAKREKDNDFLFLHLLEPHALSELYVDSILKLLKTLKVKKYILLGSMYDVVPHTRPLLVNGGASGKETQQELKKAGVFPSRYQGPTSIITGISLKALEFGIETIRFIISLPQYVVLEEDYLGKLRLMEILNLLYHIPIDERDFQRAIEQRSLISQRVERTPDLKNLLPQLETMYEVRIKSREGEGMPKLSSEIEEILWKITGKDTGKA
jgi:predicted ATP-grasp superfamily ATP-dependent carboligase